MKEEQHDYVDDDFMEERRRWEGVHNDEAAQYFHPTISTTIYTTGDKFGKRVDGGALDAAAWLE